MAVPRWVKLLALAAVFAAARRAYQNATKRSFKGDVVLVTGGGSGIGRLLALRFSQLGAKIAIWDLNEAAARAVADEITRAGGQAQAYRADVSNRTEVYELARKTISDFGQVDVVINNAGIVSGKKFLDADDAAIERTMNVNINAHFWITRAFLPPMLQRNHGMIITIASAAGVLAVAGLNEYCASKFAAFGFAESLRFELQKGGYTGVKSVCICPYYINTGMFDGVKTRWPLNILEPEYVVDQIIWAAQTGNEMLYLPNFVYLVPFGRAVFPLWFFDGFARLTGVNQSMDTFKGRGIAGPSS